MPAKDLGSKFICFKCSSKFYDLKKPEPICPKCGANQKAATAVKTERKSRLATAIPKIEEPVLPAEGAEEEAEEVDDVEEAAEEEEP